MIAHYLYTVLRALSGEKLWSRDLALEYKNEADEAVKQAEWEVMQARAEISKTREQILVAREETRRHWAEKSALLDDLQSLIEKHKR